MGRHRQRPLWFALTQLAIVLVIIVTLCFFLTCSVTFWISSSSVFADACHRQA